MASEEVEVEKEESVSAETHEQGFTLIEKIFNTDKIWL